MPQIAYTISNMPSTPSTAVIPWTLTSLGNLSKAFSNMNNRSVFNYRYTHLSLLLVCVYSFIAALTK